MMTGEGLFRVTDKKAFKGLVVSLGDPSRCLGTPPDVWGPLCGLGELVVTPGWSPGVGGVLSAPFAPGLLQGAGHDVGRGLQGAREARGAVGARWDMGTKGGHGGVPVEG